jgi:cytochrome c peroxidase
VPTLRNVANRPRGICEGLWPHNGYFTGLADIVHFYNTRDVLARCPPQIQRIGETYHGHIVGTTCWPRPEQPANLNPQLGRLGLSVADERDLVAFLETLSDGYSKTAR